MSNDHHLFKVCLPDDVSLAQGPGALGTCQTLTVGSSPPDDVSLAQRHHVIKSCPPDDVSLAQRPVVLILSDDHRFLKVCPPDDVSLAQ